MPGCPGSTPGSLPPGLVFLNVRPQAGAPGEAEKKRKLEPRRKDVWPVFVGNISFDTTEEEIRDLFGDIEGLVSWRLSIQKDGVSRGFGFAEFKTPEGALEGIKKVDGIEIKGRKLRLRWGENAPTTPEVDEFHRAPERFKTRPCYEVFKGLPCPRPDDCPYAHAQSEIRHPRDNEEKLEVKPIDPKDVVVKVVIPFQKFEGDGPEAKQRAAYVAILGPGASNIRTIMKKASCRLQLRGAGAPGGTSPEEPLHIIVKPRGDEVVTQEQIEIVRRAVDDIVETGKLPEAQGVDTIQKSTGSKAASKATAAKPSHEARRERSDRGRER
ncbi:CSTF64 [Symbiodinium pilosum]|uniref:CSTF64 protein n=1 Tax=Symbiodinium pilosum TaxID=2952 RepID=A0A812XTK2_SYMPI|nr:CSTF64 [Symbiodinium pilosum]